jgi:ABC-2 type transport system permease protein
VIDVFRFLFTRTFKNRLTRRLMRLREPRYFVPFLVSLLWFGSMVLRPIFRGPMHFYGWPPMQPDVRDAIVFVAALAIFAWVALLWILPSKRAALQFSPAETHFLFTAPVTRRQILHYKLLQAQVGILFGAGVSAFFSGARLTQMQGWSRLVGLWLFFAIMYLHAIGAGFVRTELMDRGWSGVRRRGLTIVIALVFVAAVVLGTREAWTGLVQGAAGLIDADGHVKLEGVDALSRALAHAGQNRLVGVLLWPFLVLPRLIFANTLPEFVRYAASGLVILLVHYVWVMRSDASFEEASVELAEKTAARRAARRDTVRRGGRLVTKATRFPWQLAPRGRPETAILWKNLVNLSRITPFRALFALGLFILVLLFLAIQMAKNSGSLWFIAAMMLAAIAAFTSSFGPMFVRNDLREDLFRIDTIKTFPVAGHAIVWGEVLGAWVPLAAMQCVALALASVAYAFVTGARAVSKRRVSAS